MAAPGSGLAYPEISIGRCRAQHAQDRFGPAAVAIVRRRDAAWLAHFLDDDSSEAAEQDPDQHHDDEGVPRMQHDAMNLTALSQRYNLYFVAYEDRIAVYRPRPVADNILPGQPECFLAPGPSPLSGLVGRPTRRFVHQVNNLVVSAFGSDEILVAVYDDGDVVAYYTRHVVRHVQALSAASSSAGTDTGAGSGSGPGSAQRRPELNAQRHGGCAYSSSSPPQPFFAANVGDSGWGLAVHARSRLIAVSCNQHYVTVFALALQQSSTSDQAGVSSGVREDLSPTEAFVRTRSRSWTIVIGLGTRAENLPAVSFLDDRLGFADKICAVDVMGMCWVADIWKAKTAVYGLEFEDTLYDPGWSITALSLSAFLPVDNCRELSSAVDRPGGPEMQFHSRGRGRGRDNQCHRVSVDDASSDCLRIPVVSRAVRVERVVGEVDSEDDWAGDPWAPAATSSPIRARRRSKCERGGKKVEVDVSATCLMELCAWVSRETDRCETESSETDGSGSEDGGDGGDAGGRLKDESSGLKSWSRSRQSPTRRTRADWQSVPFDDLFVLQGGCEFLVRTGCDMATAARWVGDRVMASHNRAGMIFVPHLGAIFERKTRKDTGRLSDANWKGEWDQPWPVSNPDVKGGGGNRMRLAIGPGPGLGLGLGLGQAKVRRAEKTVACLRRYHILRGYESHATLCRLDHPLGGPYTLLGLPLEPYSRPGTEAVLADLLREESDRLDLTVHVPELFLIVLGTRQGYVVLMTPTRLRRTTSGGVCCKQEVGRRRSCRIDDVLPTVADEAAGHRPAAQMLYGIAIGPVPEQSDTTLLLRAADGDGGRGYAARAGPRRTYRLMLHYRDHTILSYEISRNPKGALCIF